MTNIDLETVIRYIQKDISDTKLRVDQLIHEVQAERGTIRNLYHQLILKVDAIKATVFTHITGKRPVQETLYVSNIDFQTIVQTIQDATNVDVMEDRAFSTLKINKYRLVNKEWLAAQRNEE